MKDSNFLSLGWLDIAKGLVVAILTPVFVIVQQSLDAGVLVFEWKSILMAAIAGALGYLTKNFFTAPSTQKVVSDDLGLPEPPPRPKK